MDHPARVVGLLALFLLLFYPGTLRSVIVGEFDDQIATLFVGLALIVHFERRNPWATALLFGLGFVFKFWVAIFAAGWFLFLLFDRQARRVPAALLAAGLPFLVCNLVDRGASWSSFWRSTSIQSGYSTWTSVGFKLLSTGLLPALIVAAIAWRRRPSPASGLTLLMFALYPVYIPLVRDAHAASTMMMTCLVLVAPLLAEFALDSLRRFPRRWRGALMTAAALFYLVASLSIFARRIEHEVRPLGNLESEEFFWPADDRSPPPSPSP